MKIIILNAQELLALKAVIMLMEVKQIQCSYEFGQVLESVEKQIDEAMRVGVEKFGKTYFWR